MNEMYKQYGCDDQDEVEDLFQKYQRDEAAQVFPQQQQPQFVPLPQ
jgi:hypothetical protein